MQYFTYEAKWIAAMSGPNYEHLFFGTMALYV